MQEKLVFDQASKVCSSEELNRGLTPTLSSSRRWGGPCFALNMGLCCVALVHERCTRRQQRGGVPHRGADGGRCKRRCWAAAALFGVLQLLGPGGCWCAGAGLVQVLLEVRIEELGPTLGMWVNEATTVGTGAGILAGSCGMASRTPGSGALPPDVTFDVEWRERGWRPPCDRQRRELFKDEYEGSVIRTFRLFFSQGLSHVRMMSVRGCRPSLVPAGPARSFCPRHVPELPPSTRVRRCRHLVPDVRGREGGASLYRPPAGTALASTRSTTSSALLRRARPRSHRRRADDVRAGQHRALPATRSSTPTGSSTASRSRSRCSA